MIIGRAKELHRLRQALHAEESEFIAVYGRRRIGKTFLIKEAYEYHFAFSHAGLAGGALGLQLEEFSKSLELQGMKPKRKIKHWSDAFFALECGLQKLPADKKVVFLDELPWMDTPKSNFVSALEHFWNSWCTMRKDIVLVVCGSATSWIISKIVKNHGGLHNRLTDQIRLPPFSLAECSQMAMAKGLALSQQQVLDGYMVFGGIPFYWDRLEKGQSVDQNVDRLFFGPDAPFTDEFNQLYASLFKNAAGHVAVVTALASKKIGMTRAELLNHVGIEDGGGLTKTLNELEACGFIRTYAEPRMKVRQGIYQLIDNFTLFYFAFLSNGRNRVAGDWLSRVASPERRAWSGLAFELVCLEHTTEIKRALGISGVRTEEHAWRRRGDEEKEGAQIDLLILRADRAANICEMKYSCEPYAISYEEHRKMTHRRAAFIEDESFRGSAFLTFVTPYGVTHNAYWNDVQSEVTLQDLFQPK